MQELLVTQFDNKVVEDAAFVWKMDFWGLKTLDHYSDAIALITENMELKIESWWKFHLDDVKTWNVSAGEETNGYFFSLSWWNAEAFKRSGNQPIIERFWLQWNACTSRVRMQFIWIVLFQRKRGRCWDLEYPRLNCWDFWRTPTELWCYQEANYASAQIHGWLLIGRSRICFVRANGVKEMDVDAATKRKSLLKEH